MESSKHGMTSKSGLALLGSCLATPLCPAPAETVVRQQYTHALVVHTTYSSFYYWSIHTYIATVIFISFHAQKELTYLEREVLLGAGGNG